MTNYLARTLSLMAGLAIAANPSALIAQEEDIPPNPVTPALPGTPVTPARAGQPTERAQKVYAESLRTIAPRTEDRTLVIPKDGGEPKKMEQGGMEDINVMEHILEKAITGRDDDKQAMGILIRGPFVNPAPAHNLYLEGYGAIFFFNVNYPLLPPPAAKETSEPKDNADAEWDEARRELRHENESFGFSWGSSAGPRYGVEEYSAERVENLKKNLVAALKNAAHIRTLKPDETITVVLTGRGTVISSDRKRGTGSNRIETESKPARLLVRARKSDAEAFLRDKLSLDEFRKKTAVFIY